MSKKISKFEEFLIKKQVEKLKKEEREHYDFIRNHEKVYSRRGFMGIGLLNSFSILATPSILTLVSNKLMAQEKTGCQIGSAAGASGSPWAAFFQMDLVGGACLGASFIPLKSDGTFISASGYEKFGYTNSRNPASNEGNLSEEFGCKMDTGSSFYRGLKNGLQQAGVNDQDIENKIRAITFATESRDDNPGNKLSATQLMNEIIGQGRIANIAAASQQNIKANGSFHASAGSDKYKSVRIANANSLNALVDVGPILSRMNESQAQRLLASAQKMSERKLNEYNKLTLSDQLKELVNCGFLNANHSVFNTQTENLTPIGDEIYTSSFGNLNDAENFRQAAISKLVLTGQASIAGTFHTGYDYHNNQPHNSVRGGTMKRFEAGQRLGRFLAAAFKQGKEAVVFLATDGSASCRSNAPVSTESTETAAGFLSQGVEDNSVGQNVAFFFSPSGFKSENLRMSQIGDYRNDGAINLQNNPVVTPERTVIALAANYLNFHGKLNQLSSACSKVGLDNPFKSQEELNSVLVIPEKAS